MKKIVTLLVPILFLMPLTPAQKTNASFPFRSPKLGDFYIQKSKTKTMAGFMLLIAGITMANEEIKINVTQSKSSYPFSGRTKIKGYNKKLWLFYLARATTSASMSFLISAYEKKEQARLASKGN